MPIDQSEARMQAPWSKPVTVVIGEPAEAVAIATTQAASWAMIEDWPEEDGEALDHALLVCADVVKGKRTPEEARKAFIAAALEAGLDVTE